MISSALEVSPATHHETGWMTRTVRILLADDFEPWRCFVGSLLQKSPEWQVCEATDRLEAIQKAQEFQPDLIILDIGLSKVVGIEAVSSIRKIAPQSRILFSSANRSPDIAEAALYAGGHGYIVKSDGASELLVAIEAVLQGNRYVSSTFSGFDFTTTEGQSGDESR
jgi:DNA-binding NarL/FixJ family response regulator